MFYYCDKGIKNRIYNPGTSEKSSLNDKRGFTLIELLITIAIIGILGAVAVTAYVGSTTKASRSEAYSNLESLRLLEERFFADNGRYTVDLGITRSVTCVTGPQRDANIADIQDISKGGLPLFKPGDAAEFCYYILSNVDINGAAETPCFTAFANGLTGTRVEGDNFAIDCNNDRTF